MSKKWLRLNFRDLNIFGLKAKIPPEIKGRSSGAQFGTESSVYYLRNIHPEDWAFIKESLQYSKLNFENYTRYPDQQFKTKRINDVSLVISKVSEILKETKAGK